MQCQSWYQCKDDIPGRNVCQFVTVNGLVQKIIDLTFCGRVVGLKYITVLIPNVQSNYGLQVLR